MLMHSQTKDEWCWVFIGFKVVEGDSEGTTDLSDDEIPIFVVIETLVLYLITFDEETARNFW